MDQGALELERVNRAIEAVRNEVEREQKKLSRIGDQEYDPTASTVTKRPKLSAAAPPLEYDPGSYQMSQAGDYNPTPRSSKYTLDSDGGGSSTSSLEYVPTAVVKTAVKKRPPPARPPPAPSPSSSPPPVPAPTPYLSSSRHKYTLDNSKPPTDLEYDPLSNYSSRPGSKSAKGPVEKKGGAAAGAARVGGRKRLLSLGVGGNVKQAVEEEYVPTFKKPKQQAGAPAVDSQKYTASFSESDDESSGTEYRPTSLNRLQQKKGIGGYGDGGFRKGGGSVVSTAKERQVSEVRGAEGPTWYDSEGSDGSGPGSLHLDDQPVEKRKTTTKSGLKKASGEGSEPSRKSAGQKEKVGDGKKTDSRKPGKEESKKQGKTEGRKAEEKNRAKEKEKEKEKSLHKNGSKDARTVKSDSKKDSKSGKTEKPKGDSGSGQREKGGGGSGSSLKKVKSSDKHGGKESPKPRQQANGKLEGRGCEKVRKQGGHDKSGGSKDRPRKSSVSSSSEGKGKKAEKTPKQRSLTHVDLFGDESAEEKEKEDEADEEGQDTVVRKSAAAFRRGSFATSKRKALTPSSSENDDGDDRDNDYEDDVDADYTHLQVDLDYEEDPMEECLRIFNESKDVKTEDKGRQAKQVPRLTLLWICCGVNCCELHLLITGILYHKM